MYKKRFLVCSLFVMAIIFAVVLGGCVHINNRNYEELSEMEKQEVKDNLKEVKEEIKTEFAENGIVQEEAMDIVEYVEKNIVTD